MSEGPQEFVIYLELPPMGAKRARNAPNHKGVYTPLDYRAYKSRVAWLARSQFIFLPLTGPVRCDLTFYFARPKKPKHPIYHITKPDRDNLDKGILDSLNGICWVDDCQIAAGEIQKLYAPEGKAPGVEMRIKKL